MYELIKLSENSYYIESPTKIGLVKTDENEAILIDSGNDKDAAKKIKKILDSNGWQLKAIFNTHSHADHIGGNKYLQTQTGCKIYSYGIECSFTTHPILEPTFLWSAAPPVELRHKFLLAEQSDAEMLNASVLPHGMEMIPLSGHSFDMVGFRTNDGVIYLADSLSSAETLEKYKMVFINNVAEYLKTLEIIKQMNANYFVPSHSSVTEDIIPLAQLNIYKVMSVGDTITALCRDPLSFDQILQKVFEFYELHMTFEQHALVGSTLKAYLTWLKDIGRITSEIENNMMLWKKI